ncbi:hypothetical protein V6N13_149040 [Hibiscus sabdariffa]|uniref:Uncharacterized protein n=1 Tax=Hibiscus sabdariffa TaxID=183260 RepID=A0ABR2EII8_9ROSI
MARTNFSPWSQRLLNDYVVAFSNTGNGRRAQRPSALRWQCPPDGWIKINSNDAIHPSYGKTTTGEVLRGDKGVVVLRFQY